MSGRKLAMRKLRWAMVVVLSAAGCSSTQDKISAVPADYPLNSTSVIHCSEPCIEILNDKGRVVARRKESVFGRSYLGEVTLPPGTYKIRLMLCESSGLLPRNIVVSNYIELEPGDHFYVKYDRKEIRGNLLCYQNLNYLD